MHTPCGQKTVAPSFNPHSTGNGLSRYKNGKLLNMAEGQFDVFVSTDQNLPDQQNLSDKKLMVIILPSNQVPVVSQLIPALEQALKTIQPATFVEIPFP